MLSNWTKQKFCHLVKSSIKYIRDTHTGSEIISFTSTDVSNGVFSCFNHFFQHYFSYIMATACVFKMYFLGFKRTRPGLRSVLQKDTPVNIKVHPARLKLWASRSPDHKSCTLPMSLS